MHRLKKLVKLLLVIGLIFSLNSCGRATTKKQTKVLNVIGWSEYVPQSVLNQFTKETGIRVNYTSYSDPNQMLSKVMSSANGTYDMVLAPGMYVQTLRKLGKLAPLNKSDLPNYSNLSSAALSKPYDVHNRYSVPYLGTVMGIAYNVKKVKQVPTSYQDLLKPEFKDNLVTVEDSRAVVGSALMATGHKINDTSQQALSDASQYLTKLKKNVQVIDGDSPKTSLINGQVSAGLIYGGEIALAMENDSDIKVVFPKQSTYFCYDVFMKLKKAPNSANVEKFMNFILRPKVSVKVSKAFPYCNPNRKAQALLPKQLKDNPAVSVPTSVIKRSQTVVDLGKRTTKIDAVWNKFKNSN
ncbi:polyamine ABC transporter substrate-binding protein [Loigolactobacillus bifermentans]|jgi:spermidine/putrescine-binding protein|uniref:Spermidine putrescine ABC superfamily ATP binding cassette transporter, binding protein n=1 Tax=Loigolactobacillus bifermentans DSM 20003 TaxID=1423726 RepID=A0A0R1HBA8_9LACO|nr:spermidine/putrescine ABC transporter substrate-binding protein [Loigolactobacillus bifermentans]KRK41010.1 spermidine putrescine ABC superfamily ATP binding cassette transporter, binding protein [Loigolactobacillus bifermentans DSM 20003]QGG59905.1 extracellular solute-binding protein [Loigolactobacillus bifermentans]